MDSNKNVQGALASSTACFSTLPSNVKYIFDIDDSDDENIMFPIREDGDPPRDCEFLDIEEQEEPFDYHADHLEFKYKEELKIFEFIVNQIRLHYSDSSPFSIPTEPKELPNDDEIKKRMEEHHGPLDFESSEEKQEFFTHLKTDMMSEYKKWINSANEILQEMQSELKKSSGLNLETILAQVTNEMSPLKRRYLIKREQDLKQSPNVLKSKIEPYDLPRPPPAEFIKETIKKMKKEIVEQKVGDDIASSEKNPFDPSQLNLAFFDPILDKFDRVQLKKSLKFPLVKSILKILDGFPLGISPKVLYEEFEKENHYQIDYAALGFSSFEELLTENDSVFTVVKSEMSNLNLVFSAFVEINENLDQMQKKIAHWLLIMLQILKRPVPVQDVTSTLNKTFPLNLNVKAYGLSEELYYRTLVGCWCSNRVEFVKLPPNNKSENKKPSLFLKLSPSPTVNPNFEAYEKRSEGTSSAYNFQMLDPARQQEFLLKFQFNDPSIFFGFQLPSISDSLTAGLKYKVKPDLLLNPMDFYVCIHSQIPERSAFLSAMTEFYEDEENSKPLVIRDPEFLQPGVLIAAKFEDEWHRGKIVKLVELVKSTHGKKKKKEIVYKIYMLDMGIIGYKLKRKDIRYLTVDFTTFPIQSIPVRLRKSVLQKIFGKNYIQDAEWDDEITEYFYSFLLQKIFMIIPVSRSAMDSVWEVDLNLLDADSNVFKPDLIETMRKYFTG